MNKANVSAKDVYATSSMWKSLEIIFRDALITKGTIFSESRNNFESLKSSRHHTATDVWLYEQLNLKFRLSKFVKDIKISIFYA